MFEQGEIHSKVQLASTYSPAKKYKVSSWYATPKFDGVRAVFVSQRGLFTRNDKPINGLDLMAEELERECESRGLSFVDGELIVAGKGFQDSQSAVMSAEHPAKSQVEFHVFAAGGDFSNTADMLKAIPDCQKAHIFKVHSILIPNTPKSVEYACMEFTANGYEGVVLRHPDVPYHSGRSNHLLKYKLFKEADFRIVGMMDGEGRLAGTLGSIVVEGEVNGVHVRSCVGTGLTDDDRKRLHQNTNIVGKLLTVKYQALTEKPDKEGFYSLRFPSFIGVKEDR